MTVHAALTEGEFSLENSIKFSCRLAKKLNTKLVGVTAMPDPARAIIMSGATGHGMMISAGSDLINSIKAGQDTARADLEALFNKVCDAEGLTAEDRRIEHHVGVPSEVFPRITLLSDAFVTPHECVTVGSEHGLAFESILLDKRMPVIACGTDVPETFGTVIIAWDGSPEAARALRFHRALLRVADRILIAQNQKRIDLPDRNLSDAPETVLEYLKEIDLDAEVRLFDGKVADGLLNLAEEVNASMIISGAYGHSRLEEFIFGGVSRNLLRAEKGPALALAH